MNSRHRAPNLRRDPLDDQPDSSTSPAGDTAAVAAILREHIGALAAAADDAVAGIDRDRDELAAGELSDDLLDSVEERVRDLAADCRRLSSILEGFGDLVEETSAGAGDADASAGAPGAVETEDAPPEQVSGPGDAIEERPLDEDDPDAEEDDWDEDDEDDEDDLEDLDESADLADVGEGEQIAAPTPQPQDEDDDPIELSSGIRLLATQMSVAGAERDEIARRLREDFGVENSDRVVAQLFG